MWGEKRKFCEIVWHLKKIFFFNLQKWETNKVLSQII